MECVQLAAAFGRLLKFPSGLTGESGSKLHALHSFATFDALNTYRGRGAGAHLDTPTGKGRARRPGKPQPRRLVSKGTTLRLAGTDAPYFTGWLYQDAHGANGPSAEMRKW